MESATCILWANHATGDCNIQIVVLLKMETGCRKGSICNVTFLMNIWMGEVGFWGMGPRLGGDHSSQIILFTEHSLSFLSGRFWPIPDTQGRVFPSVYQRVWLESSLTTLVHVSPASWLQLSTRTVTLLKGLLLQPYSLFNKHNHIDVAISCCKRKSCKIARRAWSRRGKDNLSRLAG